MKNILKDEKPKFMFKGGIFGHDVEYELEINGNRRTYKSTPQLVPPEGYEGDMKEFDTPFMVFSNVFKPREEIPHRRNYFSYQPARNGVSETISFEADDVVEGIVKIKKKGDAEWFNVDDIITIKHRKMIDRDKIKPGQIWKLTIDGDLRFQNTMIMILPEHAHRLRFVYQTNVIYSDGYSETTSAEGLIDLYDKDMNMIDVDKVHLELVNDNTNPDGCDMDRTDDSLVYPSSFSIGYREEYPKFEFRKKKKYHDWEDDDDQYYDE